MTQRYQLIHRLHRFSQIRNGSKQSESQETRKKGRMDSDLVPGFQIPCNLCKSAKSVDELSVHDSPAVWMQNLAGHVGGIIRGEEDITRGDFFRLARPPEGHISSKSGDLVGGEG